MFNFLTARAVSDMSTYVASLLETFGTIFDSAWDLISGNWLLLCSVGLPLIAGILFACISFFRSR